MNLRTRLGLTTVAVVVPIALGGTWMRNESEARAIEGSLVDAALSAMENGGRARCESAPERWQSERCGASTRSGATTFEVYDRALRPSVASTPPLEGAVRARLARGATVVGRRTGDGPLRGYEAVVRMPWSEGPCAYVRVRRGVTPPFAARVPMQWAPARFVPLVIVLAVVLLALGPSVARVQRLTAAVRRSAQRRYENPVPVEGNDEVADLARAFNDAAAEVREQVAQQERRERALRNFLENTTHDIAIPLTVIQGHLAAIRKQVRDGDAVDAATVSAAMDEAHYMASLTHNLTAAARLEAAEPRVERAPMDLCEVVARTLARHRPIAAQHGIALESGVPPEALWAMGDVTLVEQALSNAAHNAIRYNRKGGHVAVLLESDGPSRFRLRVLDDGPGLSAEEIKRLGVRRARGDAARTRHPGGGGLGLDIARRVAEAHGWALSLDRSEYGGLEVRFEGSLSARPP